MNVGEKPVASKNRLLSTLAWQLGPGETREYALEGSVFIAGAAVQWLRDGLGIIRSSSEIESLAASVPDNGGVYLVPAFAGLGAPHWMPTPAARSSDSHAVRRKRTSPARLSKGSPFKSPTCWTP